MRAGNILTIAVAVISLSATRLCYAEAVVVSAASSLKEPITKIAKAFEQENPSVKVSLNFSSSAQLATQIEQGAPVDVFASADTQNVERLAVLGLVRKGAVLARNRMAVLVSNQASSRVRKLEDLGEQGIRIILPSRNVPAAQYAEQVLERADAMGLAAGQFSARVRANTVSREPDVRMVAMKVALGEGDASISYVTDVTPDLKPKIKEIALPDSMNVTANYAIAIVGKKGAENAFAQKFFDYALSVAGQKFLAQAGFLPAATK